MFYAESVRPASQTANSLCLLPIPKRLTSMPTCVLHSLIPATTMPRVLFGNTRESIVLAR